MRRVRAAIAARDRERRGLLAGEVVHPHVGAVEAELLGGTASSTVWTRASRAVRAAEPGTGW